MEKQELSEDQKRTIERNRKRALEKRQQKASPQKARTFSLNVAQHHQQVPSSSKQNSRLNNDRGSSSSNPQSLPTSTTERRTFFGGGAGRSRDKRHKGQTSISNHEAKEAVGSRQLPGTSKHFYGRKGVSGHCVLESREAFSVDIPYHAALVEVFKTLKTKSYDPSSRKWSFKLEDYGNLMKAAGCLKAEVSLKPLPRAVLQTFVQQLKGNYVSNEIPEADLSTVDSKLVDALMPFQRVGVSFSIHKKGRVLIADDMGLGKTIQAICIACYYRHLWPLLVISPSSVRFDWAQQVQRWLPSVEPQNINVVVTGKSNCTSGLVNIVSYDILARKAEEIKNKRFEVIIVDECHFLKNYKAVRTKTALPILQAAKKVILLSGTPALSRPSELFTQIAAVVPSLFNFHDFGIRYCDGKQQPWGWDFTGSSNMTELQLLLEERIMIRRQKKDVLLELPAKFRQMVLLDPQSIKTSRDLKSSSRQLSRETLKGMERRGALLEYFHHTCDAKSKAVQDYIQDMLEADKKFIVFAHHKAMLDAIEETIQSYKDGPQYIRIDGRTSSEQRHVLCKKFQSRDSVKAAVLSITAANAGINLAAASTVIFAELFWNPGILCQAEDRAHRIGQVDCVSVHYLVAQGTADDYIWPLIQTKLDVLSKAGLTKDNFSDADTMHMKDSKSADIMQYFKDSFIEEVVVTTDGNQNPEHKMADQPTSCSNSNRSSKAGPNSRQSKLEMFIVPNTKATSTPCSPVQDQTSTQCSPVQDQTSTPCSPVQDQTSTPCSPVQDQADLFCSDEDELFADMNWDEDPQQPDSKKRKT